MSHFYFIFVKLVKSLFQGILMNVWVPNNMVIITWWSNNFFEITHGNYIASKDLLICSYACSHSAANCVC